MEAAHAATPVPTAIAETLAWSTWRPAGLAGSVLAHLAGGAALLSALAGAYKMKRRLGIDVFPRVDMLPDAQIEASIDAVVRLLAW